MKYLYFALSVEYDKEKDLWGIKQFSRCTFEPVFNFYNEVDIPISIIQYPRVDKDIIEYTKWKLVTKTKIWDLFKDYGIIIIDSDNALIENAKKLQKFMNEYNSDSKSKRDSVYVDIKRTHTNILTIDPITLNNICQTIEDRGYGEIYDIDWYLDKAIFYTKDDYMGEIIRDQDGFKWRLLYDPED